MNNIDRIKELQADAAEILEDLIRAERFPDAEKKQVQERCYRRLAPIYDNLRRLTLLPDIKDLKDDALLNLYQSSNGEPGDEFVDALAEEIERRGLNK